jgi:phosphatidylserine/phosphatidylglycerophosphate/cardiolipin synthase-like enzyme/membrane protein DedA with SNARE-associated domain
MNTHRNHGASGPQNNLATAPLKPGVNCWRVEKADRVGVIVDAADYFAAFAEACRAAQRQILILGWDFDRHVRLHRDDRKRDLPDRLGAFLAALVKRRRGLKIYLLSWDFNMIYAAERELLPALRLRLQAPPRFHFRLDGEHPSGASHHQKVVVIDDRLAFVGGIDLSRWRWDTSRHTPQDPRRTDPNGKPYPPFHDLMMVVAGAAAARLGELARERWRRAHGWKLKPPGEVDSSPWPASVANRLEAVSVAIARTEPAHAGRTAVEEVRRLYLDVIAGARRFIYIENQYFTARCLADALIARLQETDGPEVILVLPQRTGGWLEQVTMDVLRGRVVARMRQADRHDRLRIFFPFQTGLGDDCISVHAKLLISDDRLLRIGSSNTSNRSMGMDTECDLAIAAQQSAEVADFIRSLRRRLLAEHLDCSIEDLAAAESRHGGLIAAITALMGPGRSLRPLDCRVDEGLDEMVPDGGLVDPSEPISPDYFLARYIPKDQRPAGRKRLIAFLAVIVALLALAAAWRWTPLQDWLSPQRVADFMTRFSSPSGRALIAVAGVGLASVLMVPLTFLAVVGAFAFPGWLAFVYVLAGALVGSAIGFIGGRVMSRGALERISGSRLGQLSRQLAKRGTIAVAVLRLVPIAPFAVFNLVAGASHLGFRQFIVGSLLGMTPGLGAITFFSGTLWAAVSEPSWENLAIAAAAGLGLTGLALFAKRWLRSG